MKNIKFVVSPGFGEYGRVYLEIELEDGKLSITGVEGPFRNGNCRGSCGQIQDNFVPGYWKGLEKWAGNGVIEKLIEIWNRWHLNNMRAGTIEQENFIREWEKKVGSYDYIAACEALKKAGLYEVPHPNKQGEVYKYGNEWLKEELPADVIEFIIELKNKNRVETYPWK